MIQINDLNLNNSCDSALGRVDANELNAIVGGAAITSPSSGASEAQAGANSMASQQSEQARQFQLQTSQIQAQQMEQQMQQAAYGNLKKAARNSNGQ